MNHTPVWYLLFVAHMFISEHNKKLIKIAEKTNCKKQEKIFPTIKTDSAQITSAHPGQRVKVTKSTFYDESQS